MYNSIHTQLYTSIYIGAVVLPRVRFFGQDLFRQVCIHIYIYIPMYT